MRSSSCWRTLVRACGAAGVVGALAAAAPLAAAAQQAAKAPGDETRQVQRLAAGDRVATAIAVAGRGWPDGAGVVLLATADGSGDALGAVPLAAARDAPILLTPPGGLRPDVGAELRRLRPGTVILLGGRGALGEDVERDVRQIGARVERIAGEDPYATAALTARAAMSGTTVAVTSGEGFADAVAAGALASTPSRPPTLLVRADAVPRSTRAALADLRPEHTLVVGGAAAITNAVAAGLPGRVERLAGATRVETSLTVATLALATLDAEHRPLVVTTADGFADALPAGAFAARSKALLVLVPASTLPPPVAEFLAAHRHRFDRGIVVGGRAAVSEIVERQLARGLNGLSIHAPPLWRPPLASAAEYAGTRRGDISFAASATDGAIVGHRADTRVQSASVLKVMFMTAYLRQADVRDRDLDDADRALLEPMIRQSANEPATRIADELGAAPMNELAALAGMRNFAYTRPWGRTLTSARDQVPFMLALPDLLPPRHVAYALQLLTEIVPEQRWGVAALAVPAGWSLRFKGGWGMGTGAVDHQVVLLRHCSGTQVGVAVMTTSSPSHAYGTETLRGVFERLLSSLPAQAC